MRKTEAILERDVPFSTMTKGFWDKFNLLRKLFVKAANGDNTPCGTHCRAISEEFLSFQEFLRGKPVLEIGKLLG